MEGNKDIVNGEINNEELLKEDIVNKEDKEMIKEEDPRNLKEKLYDKIAIPIKVLDVVIAVAIVILVIMIIYFVIRKYS